ncbi:MAG: hypothetical protein VXZ38_12935, partial [Planctomycetota bacterium]|nr:hypothetical protein [Planctomycetota bacterium]
IEIHVQNLTFDVCTFNITLNPHLNFFATGRQGIHQEAQGNVIQYFLSDHLGLYVADLMDPLVR